MGAKGILLVTNTSLGAFPRRAKSIHSLFSSLYIQFWKNIYVQWQYLTCFLISTGLLTPWLFLLIFSHHFLRRISLLCQGCLAKTRSLQRGFCYHLEIAKTIPSKTMVVAKPSLKRSIMNSWMLVFVSFWILEGWINPFRLWVVVR